MKITHKILGNTKIPLDIWLFFLFLLTFSLTLRKVILHFTLQRTFNEYAGVYIYISDILFGVTIVLWLFTILYNTSNYSSTYSLCLPAGEAGITWLKYNLSTASRNFLKSYYLSIPLLLVIWSFISIAWSDNQTIALFRSVKLLEFYILYLYIILRIVPRGTIINYTSTSPSPILIQKNISPTQNTETTPPIKKCSTWNISFLIIIFVSLIQSIIGILQVATQHSIGLALLGESLIGQDIPGVAKIVFHGEHYIRAYGLFPHPNILGGYLLFSIILTFLYLRMFHACPVKKNCSTPAPLDKNVPRGTFWNFSGWNNSFFYGAEHSLRYKLFITRLIYFSLIIQITALLFSLSKSAILGLIISLLYIYVPRGTSHAHTNICSTWNNSRIRIIILSVLIIISFGLIANQDLSRNLKQSFDERLTYLNVSRGTILANPILGTGIGQSVWNMQEYSPVPLEAWQLQPVHNVFLLIWSELGIVGLGLFIYWLYKVFAVKSILSNDYTVLSMGIPLHYFKGILLGFIFIMLFDHYFWDIQQGSLMLWIVMGIIANFTSNLNFFYNYSKKYERRSN